MFHKHMLLVLTVLLLISSGLIAQALEKLPEAVEEELSERLDACLGKPPLKSPGFLIITDLTGDSIPDFVIDYVELNCSGRGMFSGSGGSQVQIYVGTKGGQAFKAFRHGKFSVKIDKKTKPARLMLGVGGVLCGQTNFTSKASAWACMRPVIWNDRTREFEFAPLSQIQPIR